MLKHSHDAQNAHNPTRGVDQSGPVEDFTAARVAALEAENAMLLGRLDRAQHPLENLGSIRSDGDAPTGEFSPARAAALQEENIFLLRELHRMQRAYESLLLTQRDGTSAPKQPLRTLTAGSHPLRTLTATSLLAGAVILVLSKLTRFVPDRLLTRARPLRDWLIGKL